MRVEDLVHRCAFGGLFVLILLFAAFKGLQQFTVSECVLDGGAGATEMLSATGSCKYDFGFGMVTSSYRGELRRGAIMHGRGRQEADNCVYEGSFVDNKRHGSGSMMLFDGSRLTGLWKDNYMSGEGVFQSPSDLRNISSYLRNAYTNIYGARYEGDFHRNLPEGLGKVVFAPVRSGAPHRESYEGTWRHGVIDGDGTLVLEDGLSFRTTVTKRNDRNGFVQVDLKGPIVVYAANVSRSATLIPPDVHVFLPADSPCERDEGCSATPCDSEQCTQLARTLGKVLHTGAVLEHHKNFVARVMGYVWDTTPARASLPKRPQEAEL